MVPSPLESMLWLAALTCRYRATPLDGELGVLALEMLQQYRPRARA